MAWVIDPAPPPSSPGNPPAGGFMQVITVRNAATSASIQGALVTYAQAGAIRDTATTGADGVARIGVTAGTYDRTVVAPGFDSVADSVTVSTPATVAVNLTLLSPTGTPVNVAPGMAN